MGQSCRPSVLGLERIGELVLWHLQMSTKYQASQFLLVTVNIPWLFHLGRTKHVWHICWHSPILSTPCQTQVITRKWPQHSQHPVGQGRQEKLSQPDCHPYSVLCGWGCWPAHPFLHGNIFWASHLNMSLIESQACNTLRAVFTAASLFYLSSVLVLISF